MNLFKKFLSLVAILLMASFAGARPAQEKTIVLVHGAFADGSSWQKVIPLLRAKGYKVVAVQNPLTSLADDVATAKRAVENQPGPVILVGHSWGGVVISELGGNNKVASLVYVAAFAPSEGQSAGDLLMSAKTSVPGLSEGVTDPFGFITLTEKGVHEYFAQDLPKKEADVIASTQGPTSAAAFDQKTSVAAWRAKPSWYIIADKDMMIPPDLQGTMAQSMNAKITHLPTSHVPMLSQPAKVAAVILEAAEQSGN